jgi:hypothetical protein
MRRHKVSGLAGLFFLLLTPAASSLEATSHGQSACLSPDLPKSAFGLCNTPLFKSYVSCIEKFMPNWDPKGPALIKNNFPAASGVLSVLIECEPIAKSFGKRYGNNFANILQSVANRRISDRYGTKPLVEPSGDPASFLEFGERVAPSEIKFGDLHDDRNGSIRRPVGLRAQSVIALFIKSCQLQVDGESKVCDDVSVIDFNDGGRSVQFNNDNKTVVSFFGKDLDPNTISINAVLLADKSNETEAQGQCILGQSQAGCQARTTDGHLFTSTILLDAEKRGNSQRGR